MTTGNYFSAYYTRVTITLVSLLLFSLAEAQIVTVSYTSNIAGTFSGKVYLYLSKENKEPKERPAGMDFSPCFSIVVNKIKPGEKAVFNDSAQSYPVAITDLERGQYYVQAVWDRNLGGRAIGNSPGNMYNPALKITFSKNNLEVFNLNCTEAIDDPTFKETRSTKEMKVPSRLLSFFYQHPVTFNAAIKLPKEYYDDTLRRFPVLYYVHGYGGDYHHESGRESFSNTIDTTPCIIVVLDGNCPLGHSVYANSENNGPWGDALTHEFIPTLEERFRCNGVRLLSGHSSGGWTVLSLILHYPKVFSACWSSSPDPVDFTNFQTVNLYKDKNLFYARDSSLKMVATVAGFIPWQSQKNAYQWENVIDRGEQMHSFDAVFSQRNMDGTPRKLLNEKTGDIDPITVEHWKKYDLALTLKNNWTELKPLLDGKIRISVGDNDNFLLNYAVHQLEEVTKKLNANFIYAYYPGDHFTVSSPEYMKAGWDFLESKCNTIGR